MEELVGRIESRTVSSGRWYERWLLLLLVLIYASSFVDRIIVAVVGPAIKAQMALTDLQLGLLGGFAFSIFYATLGIPIARLAEKYNRIVLTVLSIVAWSVMTVLCGTANSFSTLLAYRLGVGIGEAGSTPTTHSLISDQFPASRRATALGIYALGPPLGVVIGALGGGLIAQHLGWRAAFYIVGVPGLVLGLLAYLTLREPARGTSGRVGSGAKEAVPPLREVLSILLKSRVIMLMASGVMTTAFALFGMVMFLPMYMERVFGMNFMQAGLAFAIVNGIGGMVGGLIGGYSSDWASRRDKRWYAWIPALGALLGIPLMVASYLSSGWYVAIPLMLLASIVLNLWNGPTFAVVHTLVEPRMRATASAFVFLMMNLVGQGLGPATVGFLSDRFAKHFFLAGDYRSMCVPAHGGEKVAAMLSSCQEASASGLRYALLAVTVTVVLSAFCFYRASCNITREMEF